MLMSSLSLSRMGRWDLLSCQLKSTFSSCLCSDSSLNPNTPVISFALGSGTLYRLPGVVSKIVSQWGDVKTPGLAKIGADFPNAAASGIFLEHFCFSAGQNGELWAKKGLTVARTNKSFQLANLIQLFHCSSELTILCISSMPLYHRQISPPVSGCQN